MSADETIGATLGSYKVTAKLGQGGMGAVYLAEHPLLGRKAAVKVLLPELSSHTDSVERFFHEARTTARLRHPAMVDVFDFGTLPDGRAYLIMDFLEGECLEARIRDHGALAVPEALRIARDIALGVSVAHAEQIVHRDLKPDNIFLLPPVAGNLDERVKILDFGIAKLARKPGDTGPGMTRVGAVMGTPLYMSPEQCRGSSDVDSRADIYSLGCILFAMLAGRPPFVSESMGELMGLHQLAPPPTLDSLDITVPAAVESLVQTLLAKSPDHRPASMVAVADTMDRLMRQLTVKDIKTALTLSLPSREAEVPTKRGRPAPQALQSAATEADMRTERMGADSGGAPGDSGAGVGTAVSPGGTLDGRSISEAGRTTFTGHGRKPLVIGAAALAVVVAAAGGLWLYGRSGPHQAAVPVSAGGNPPAVERAARENVPVPAELVPVAPAIPAPPPEVSPPAAELTPSRTPARRSRGGGRRVAKASAAGQAGLPPAAVEPPPAAKDAEKNAAQEAAREVARDAERNAARDVDKDKDKTKAASPRAGRPIYRGTQLQIEKNDPY
jgi:eukaryotic-like serine/threonine-protein kinase